MRQGLIRGSLRFTALPGGRLWRPKSRTDALRHRFVLNFVEPCRVLIPSPLQKYPMGTFVMAERQGFEPWKGFPLTVFKTAAFDRSATSPSDCAVYPSCFTIANTRKQICLPALNHMISLN